MPNTTSSRRRPACSRSGSCPDQHGVAPGWGTRAFPRQVEGALAALADGRPEADGSALPLYADAAVLAGTLRRGQTRAADAAARAARPIWWRRPARVTVNGTPVATRDGAAITGETDLAITATEDADVVLVDVVG